MIEQAPISFEPYLKGVIWGGTKICEYKGIPQSGSKVGESWEVSSIPGFESVVADGIYKGMSLSELVERFGESLLGEKSIRKYGKNFPLLVKIIDAADNLSVQVHPDDALAARRHNSMGKTEMWYVIQAEPDAEIYVGLKERMTPEEYTARVADGSFPEALAVHSSEAGDVFFLPAGRVHAIGNGNLVAEIQQSSDITYRIFDYNRKDANGNMRELHTELAKDAIDFNVYDDYKKSFADRSDEDCELASCEHFVTRRVIVNGERPFEPAKQSFTIIMCIEGEADLCYVAGEKHLRRGHTVLLPANMPELSVEGHATLIVAHL